jgi:hypothetical protein
LRLDGRALEEAIDGLPQAGFLVATDSRVAEGRKFLYRPASPALGEVFERLAEALDRDPFPAARPHESPRARTAAHLGGAAFASAF